LFKRYKHNSRTDLGRDEKEIDTISARIERRSAESRASQLKGERFGSKAQLLNAETVGFEPTVPLTGTPP
jgi:hypothetical protein